MTVRAAAADRLLLPAGYKITDSFSAQSGIVLVNNGAGVGANVPQVIVSAFIPSGAKAYIQSLNFRIIDLSAYDQLYFAIRRNGGLVVPYHNISGEQVVEDTFVPVDDAFDPGLFEIVCKNIAGTTEPNASPDQLNVRVIARWTGYLLSRR